MIQAYITEVVKFVASLFSMRRIYNAIKITYKKIFLNIFYLLSYVLK